MSSWIVISERAGDLLMTAVLLVRFHVRRNLGLWPEVEQARRRKNTHEHGGGQQGKGFSGDTKCRSNREPQGNWYAVRLVLGRNWINDDNLKAAYKEEGEQWQYGFFNLRRRCSARR